MKMSESGMVGVMFICIAVVAVLFGGDPDLMDGLIYYLTEGKLTASE